MNLVVNANANASLAILHAEGSAEHNLIFEAIIGNKLLKAFNNLARAFEMAG